MNANDTATTVPSTCDKLCCCRFRDCTAARTKLLDVGPGIELIGYCDTHIPFAVADMRETPVPFSVR